MSDSWIFDTFDDKFRFYVPYGNLQLDNNFE